MKTIITLLLFCASQLQAQNTRLSAQVQTVVPSFNEVGLRIGIEQFIVGPLQAELSSSISLPHLRSVTALQFGVETNRGGQYDEFMNTRISAGPFYHAPFEVDKAKIPGRLYFGGALRFELKRLIAIFEYDGEAVVVGAGFLIRKRGERP